MHKITSRIGSFSAWANERKAMTNRHRRRKEISRFISLIGGPSFGSMHAPACLSTELIAYLWMAIDANLNAIVTGNSDAERMEILNAASGFVNSRINVVTIEKELNALRTNEHFSNITSFYGKKHRITARESIVKALELRPARIVIDEIYGAEAGVLFSGASMNSSFLAAMKSEGEPPRIAKRLMSKTLKVDKKHIGMLDFSIHANGYSGNSVACDVYEYRWLSRAEILDGIEIGDDALLSRRIVERGHLDRQRLQSSKALYYFGKKHGYSMSRSIQELDRRARFLGENMHQWSMANTAALTEKYLD